MNIEPTIPAVPQPAPTPQGDSASFWFNPKRWPLWLKLMFAPVAITVLTFYYRDQRMGDGFFAGKPVFQEVLFSDAGQSFTATISRPGRTVDAVYGDGTKLPADGAAVALWTLQDHRQVPARLEQLKGAVLEKDLPVVVWMNSSHFDASGDPIVIRSLKDGKELYRADPIGTVALATPLRDGRVRVIDATGFATTVDDAYWFKSYVHAEDPAPPIEPLPNPPQAQPTPQPQPKAQPKADPKAPQPPLYQKDKDTKGKEASNPLVRPVRPQ